MRCRHHGEDHHRDRHHHGDDERHRCECRCECHGKGEHHAARGCGCGGEDGHGGCCGGERHGFRRSYPSKAEVIAELESYLAELKAEVQGVEERLAELRG